MKLELELVLDLLSLVLAINSIFDHGLGRGEGQRAHCAHHKQLGDAARTRPVLVHVALRQANLQGTSA